MLGKSSDEFDAKDRPNFESGDHNFLGSHFSKQGHALHVHRKNCDFSWFDF